jgi:hypothetical protein
MPDIKLPITRNNATCFRVGQTGNGARRVDQAGAKSTDVVSGEISGLKKANGSSAPETSRLRHVSTKFLAVFLGLGRRFMRGGIDSDVN